MAEKTLEQKEWEFKMIKFFMGFGLFLVLIGIHVVIEPLHMALILGPPGFLMGALELPIVQKGLLTRYGVDISTKK